MYLGVGEKFAGACSGLLLFPITRLHSMRPLREFRACGQNQGCAPYEGKEAHLFNYNLPCSHLMHGTGCFTKAATTAARLARARVCSRHHMSMHCRSRHPEFAL